MAKFCHMVKIPTHSLINYSNFNAGSQVVILSIPTDIKLGQTTTSDKLILAKWFSHSTVLNPWMTKLFSMTN